MLTATFKLVLVGGVSRGGNQERMQRFNDEVQKRVKELNLENNVVFVNKFLSIDELLRYIQMSDIYLTPYLTSYIVLIFDQLYQNVLVLLKSS